MSMLLATGVNAFSYRYNRFILDRDPLTSAKVWHRDVVLYQSFDLQRTAIALTHSLLPPSNQFQRSEPLGPGPGSTKQRGKAVLELRERYLPDANPLHSPAVPAPPAWPLPPPPRGPPLPTWPPLLPLAPWQCPPRSTWSPRSRSPCRHGRLARPLGCCCPDARRTRPRRAF